jgi:hypothetical protein
MLQPSHFVSFSVTTFSHLRTCLFFYFIQVYGVPVYYHNFLCHRKSVTTQTRRLLYFPPASSPACPPTLSFSSHPLSHIHFFRFHRWPFVVLLYTKMCMYGMFLTSETLRFGWSHLQTFEKSLFALAITSLVYGKILKRKLSVKRTATFGCQCSLVTNLKSPQVAIKGRNMYL